MRIERIKSILTFSGNYPCHEVPDRKYSGFEDTTSQQCYQMLLADWLTLQMFKNIIKLSKYIES